jgi:hypothetical protein
MTSQSDRYFRCAPSSARKRTLSYFLSLYGSLGVIGIVSLIGSAPRPIAVVGVPAILLFVAWGATRARRVSITASAEHVVVSNQFRTRLVRWDEIDRIELSRLPGYLGSYVPALAFRKRSGWRVKAQAVPSSRWDQEAMLKDWRRVAPANVIVDMDVDAHRPVRLLKSR